MFLAGRPSPQAIERFISRSQDLPLSYGPVGILGSGKLQGDLDEAEVAIGRGSADFARARAALLAWKPFDLGWVQLFPPYASVDVGTVVAVLIRHFGFWSSNACRVVYRVEHPHHDDRCGFAYGTLTNHAESGEELFEVFRNPQTDEVMFRIRAISRPQVTLARLGYPLVRLLQARFRRDSAETMKRATAESRR